MTSARFAKWNGCGREGDGDEPANRGTKQDRALVTAVSVPRGMDRHRGRRYTILGLMLLDEPCEVTRISLPLISPGAIGLKRFPTRGTKCTCTQVGATNASVGMLARKTTRFRSGGYSGTKGVAERQSQGPNGSAARLRESMSRDERARRETRRAERSQRSPVGDRSPRWSRRS